jgi:hypothetical protein
MAFDTETLRLLCKFAQLKILALQHLKFDSQALLNLHTLSNLRHFTLVGNNTLNDLNFVKPWRSLETLCVRSCRNLLNVDAIRHLPLLHTLDLDYCSNIEDPGSDVIARLSTLKNLSARSVPVIRQKFGVVYF